MKVTEKNFSKLTNYIFQFLSIGLLFFYIFNNLANNRYETLFIDERLLIDDIYNVWLIEDTFNRYSNISNQIIKNFLIIFTELAYGGDLRYGRLWTNLFVFLIGPATFFSDIEVIIFSRLLNALLFFCGAYFISKYLLEKKYLWISIFVIYSFDKVEFLHRVPKPDSMALIFVALGLKFLLDKKYYYSIFFLAISSFLKINTVVVFIVLWITIFLFSNLDKVKLIKNTSILTFLSLIIVNPILLIPPLNINSIQLPNFYKIYFNWLTTQGSSSSEIEFTLRYFDGWINELSTFYYFPNKLLFISTLLIFLGVSFFTILNSSDNLSKYLLVIFCLYIFFYFFFIERAWTWYLHLPFTLLLIAFLRSLREKKNKFIPLLLIFLVGCVGNISNLDRYLNDTQYRANDRLAYVDIETVEDAEDLVNEVINEIKIIYSLNDYLDKKIVFWHPELLLPRNRVTYNDDFFVREYWGNKDVVDYALEESDIFVTFSDYKVESSVTKIQVRNFYIYYLNNLD